MALEFLLAPANLPFTGALAAAATLGLVEMVGLVTGMSFATGEGDADGGVEADGDAAPGPLAAAYGWMNAGRLPLLALLMVFLTCFACIGLAVQSLTASLTGSFLTPLALLGAVGLGLPATRVAGRGLAALLPRDESYAFGPRDFIGCRGVIAIGPAAADSPGRAAVKDRLGRLHNLWVVPAAGQDTLPRGTPVLILDHDQGRHVATRLHLPGPV